MDSSGDIPSNIHSLQGDFCFVVCYNKISRTISISQSDVDSNNLIHKRK